MEELDIWIADNLETRRPDFETKVDVIICDRETLIETIHAIIGLRSSKQTRSRYRLELLNHTTLGKRPGIASVGSMMRGGSYGMLSDTKIDAKVLHRKVLVKKTSTNDTYLFRPEMRSDAIHKV